MIPRASHPRYFSFVQPCGNSDRLIRFMICLLSLATLQELQRQSTTMAKSWAFQVSATKLLEDTRRKHAVLWENGGVTDLGNLGAQWWNTPTAINQRGDIVGFAGDPAFVEGDIVHAFIWTRHRGIQPLLALPGRTPEHVDSEAYGINERGQVVGTSCDANFVDCRAVVWDHSAVPTDLNDLKAPGFPARLESAKDINDNGEITGRAIDANNVRTAYLAVPVHGH